MKKLVLLSLALVFFSVNAYAAEYVFKFGHTANSTVPIYDAYEHFAKLVTEKTNGRMQVLVFPSGQLGSDMVLAESVLNGSLEAASISNSNMSPFTDIFQWTSLPCLINSPEGARKIFNGDIGKDLAKRLEETTDFKVLLFADFDGLRMPFTRNKQIRSPHDLKGLKLRSTASPVEMDCVRAYGANPTPVSWGELYTGLEQGVVEGIFQDYMWLDSAKLGEVLKNVTEVPYGVGGYVIHMVLCNKKVFATYPTEIQKALLESGQETSAFLAKQIDQTLPEIRERLIQNGLVVYTPTDQEAEEWFTEAQKVWSKYTDIAPQAFIDSVLAAQK